MTVRELMFALGELELSGKGDAAVDIYCDGYAASAVGVFVDRFGVCSSVTANQKKIITLSRLWRVMLVI